MALFEQTTGIGLPLLTDVAVDAVTGLPVETDGQLTILTGQQALRQWIRFALDPQSRRFAYAAHTAAYGNELEMLMGRPLAEAESRLPDIIRQALGVSPYITAITDLSLRSGQGELTADFTLDTVYGLMEYEGEAILYEYL